MHDPKLQQSLHEAAKKGDINLMMQLIKQGANALTLTEECKPIIAKSNKSSIMSPKTENFNYFFFV